MSNNSSPPPFMNQYSASSRPEMTEVDYEIWREFVHQKCGLDFTPGRQHFLQARLWERMQMHQLRQYSDYYHYVLYNPRGKEEWGALLDLLLNNESSFFRHTPSFVALTEHVLPALFKERQRQNVNQLAFWSAGCANGQEAYSLAMAFQATVPPDQTAYWRVRVWGTDISRRGLHKAKNGRYKPYDIRSMPDQYRRRYMRQVENGRDTYFDVSDEVRRLVQFGELNFTDPDNYWISTQDIIFCQNVLIYFRSEERVKLVERLCNSLNIGGYLFLAPAELIGLKLPGIRPVRLEESLVYQRVS